MIKIKLPFTDDPKDRFFVGALRPLQKQGVKLSPDESFTIWAQARAHLENVTEHCGPYWWNQFTESDTVDISHPNKSLYPLAFSKMGKHLPREIEQKSFTLFVYGTSREIMITMNHFFNEMIRHLRANPALTAS